MWRLSGFIGGLVVLALLAGPVAGLVERSALRPPRPEGLPDVLWKELLEGADRGKWFGTLERWLLYFAFLVNAPALVAAWFAFKLASKWEVWKNVIRVPTQLDGMTDAEWFAFTHRFGSWVLQRFWVGTLANTLLAMAIAWLSRSWPFLVPPFHH